MSQPATRIPFVETITTVLRNAPGTLGYFPHDTLLVTQLRYVDAQHNPVTKAQATSIQPHTSIAMALSDLCYDSGTVNTNVIDKVFSYIDKQYAPSTAAYVFATIYDEDARSEQEIREREDIAADIAEQCINKAIDAAFPGAAHTVPDVAYLPVHAAQGCFAEGAWCLDIDNAAMQYAYNTVNDFDDNPANVDMLAEHPVWQTIMTAARECNQTTQHTIGSIATAPATKAHMQRTGELIDKDAHDATQRFIMTVPHADLTHGVAATIDEKMYDVRVEATPNWALARLIAHDAPSATADDPGYIARMIHNFSTLMQRDAALGALLRSSTTQDDVLDNFHTLQRFITVWVDHRVRNMANKYDIAYTDLVDLDTLQPSVAYRQVIQRASWDGSNEAQDVLLAHTVLCNFYAALAAAYLCYDETYGAQCCAKFALAADDEHSLADLVLKCSQRDAEEFAETILSATALALQKRGVDF